MVDRTFVAAALQMCARDDIRANLDTCRRGAAHARDAGASLLVLPECFAFLGRHVRDRFAVAEAISPERPGPILDAVMAMARDHALWVVAGGLPERPEPPAAGGEPTDISHTYNTCVVVSPAGELVAAYRKIHLFDVDIPGRVALRESDHTLAGRDIVVAATDLARIGLSICYDVRFPELYRELVTRLDAQVLVVPAAFTAHTGAAHWHLLVRARAVENQCYAIAAAQVGRHNDKRESYGHSLIVDPWGAIVAELADGEGVITATIDLDMVAETRQRMPCLDHRVLVD